MATKRYSQVSFNAEVNGRVYNFDAYTTRTRNGFCHTIQTWCDYRSIASDTKVSYYNRTWESFEYESALRRAIEKCPKADQQELKDILIYRKKREEHEKAERFVKAFEQTWSKVSDENKERIRNAVGTIDTEEQAQAVMGVAKLAVLMQNI